MNPTASRSTSRRSWRAFPPRDGREIDGHLIQRRIPCCPWCGDVLEARPDSRLARSLPLGAVGYDLDCRGCRRFWCVVRHTARSLRLVRMRRLAAAVKAVGPRRNVPIADAPQAAASSGAR